ncbi:DUF2267 domain-containing protein [Streptomyces sp. NWU49]|uniref:DUF2267 domain-containing protein n=1 Tax=Streptomyces sp. NWU49 TaxID=2201153 RepID=UPI000D67FF25|nr:DUF2267 domain-containing protein [Streptomyces sp. NWU49]PWJ05396.1 DUF2267 domain-containing protein [Streptomyces sp. NWU49]
MASAWEQFLAQVQNRGEYATTREAERVTRAVLATLSAHLAGTERRELAEHLPPQCGPLLLDPLPATRPLNPHEFLEAVAHLIEGATPETARWDAGAVLSSLAETAGDDLLHRILTQLPPGYALLFGRAELA